VRPLEGVSVVDLSRYLPGPFATRELLDLGASVTRLLPPDGDPMADLAPAWHDALNTGKETVVVDLKAEPATVSELDRQLSLNESVLRTKVMRTDKH
jgi:crotonobetainyl-CoA:carnitine CoA-transferase CaiB-like acyl-CoA transferase